MACQSAYCFIGPLVSLKSCSIVIETANAISKKNYPIVQCFALHHHDYKICVLSKNYAIFQGGHKMPGIRCNRSRSSQFSTLPED